MFVHSGDQGVYALDAEANAYQLRGSPPAFLLVRTDDAWRDGARVMVDGSRWRWYRWGPDVRARLKASRAPGDPGPPFVDGRMAIDVIRDVRVDDRRLWTATAAGVAAWDLPDMRLAWLDAAAAPSAAAATPAPTRPAAAASKSAAVRSSSASRPAAPSLLTAGPFVPGPTADAVFVRAGSAVYRYGEADGAWRAVPDRNRPRYIDLSDPWGGWRVERGPGRRPGPAGRADRPRRPRVPPIPGAGRRPVGRRPGRGLRRRPRAVDLHGDGDVSSRAVTGRWRGAREGEGVRG